MNNNINVLRTFCVVIFLFGIGLGFASEPKTTVIGSGKKTPAPVQVQDAGEPAVNLDRRLELVVSLDKVRDEVGGSYKVLWSTEQVTATKDSAVVVITTPSGQVSALIFVWTGKSWAVFPDQFNEALK